MNLPSINIEDYSYGLPDHRIAEYPLANRDESKLLEYKHGAISSGSFANLHNHLPEQTLLVLNNTRVVQARLHFKKDTGAKIEIFCLEPKGKGTEISRAMSATGTTTWKCLVGNAKRWKNKDLKQEKDGVALIARHVGISHGDHLVKFSWSPQTKTFAEILLHFGVMPLPPYIERKAEVHDTKRYQTIYARPAGSVAAPTAGLHLTERVFDALKKKGVEKAALTLHVGAGTFLPVKSAEVKNHRMHSEFFDVPKQLIEMLRSTDRKVVPVGTTSLRTLESLYWIGLDPEKYYEPPFFRLPQWTPYQSAHQPVPPHESLSNLSAFMDEKRLRSLKGKTELMIVPGYDFKFTDGLLTNFHQPKSTLLLLVAALIGERWKDVYQYALENDFRFLSYGDGSLLWKPTAE